VPEGLPMPPNHPTNPRTARAHPRASSSRGREVDIRALNQDPRDLKRTRRECQGEIMTSGTCQASCQTRQNSSANAQRQGSRATLAEGSKRARRAETRSGGTAQLPEDPEGPRTVRNERVDRTNSPNQDTRPGGHMGPQEVTRVVEGDSGRGNVVEGGAHNGIAPGAMGTSALRRGRGPGGH
ncbi:hypothetical protein EV363DRAFT_1201065, partial [Boletus edulis]